MSHVHDDESRADAHLRPRRQFLKKSFTFFGAAASTAATARSKPTRESEALASEALPEPREIAPPKPSHAAGNAEPWQVFDAHLHCPSDQSRQVWQWYPVTKSFAEFASYLTRTGVQRGIINNVQSQLAKTPAEFIAGNREVARYVEQYKGRFVGASVVNPLFIDEALREIEDCRKQLGFVWVGELCNYTVPYQYTVKEFEQLVQQVVKMNMVLDVHTELEEMDYIIGKFPQATLVFPHFGDSNEGQHIFKRIDAVAKHPNCYLDTSGYGHDRVGMLEYAVKAVGPDRVLFGSDFSINDPSTVIARIQNAFLSVEEKRKILSENLQALLKKVQSSILGLNRPW
jgi:predicted TIM-barrel fold metal-dependent hydrolase